MSKPLKVRSPDTSYHYFVQEDSRKYAIRDTTNLRWQPGSVILTSVYDQIAADMMEKARERVGGVSDHRYQLHEANFGTLLLQVTGVRDRTKTPRMLSPLVRKLSAFRVFVSYSADTAATSLQTIARVTVSLKK